MQRSIKRTIGTTLDYKGMLKRRKNSLARISKGDVAVTGSCTQADHELQFKSTQLTSLLQHILSTVNLTLIVDPKHYHECDIWKASLLYRINHLSLLQNLFAKSMRNSLLVLFFLALVGHASAFVSRTLRSSFPIVVNSRLFIFPSLQKFTDKGEYNKVVDGLMVTQGISREQAEKEYDGK
jgi:hypothetical protein